MKIHKYTSTLLAALLLAVSVPTAAYAESSGEPIDRVTLHITSYIEEGGTHSPVTVTADSSQYHVSSCEVTNTPDDEWDYGDQPKLEVTVEAASRSYFSSGFSKDRITLMGSDGTCTAAARRSRLRSRSITTGTIFPSTSAGAEPTHSGCGRSMIPPAWASGRSRSRGR